MIYSFVSLSRSFFLHLKYMCHVSKLIHISADCWSGSCGETMSSFVSHVDPVTGKMDWILQNDDYDYHQEIARSSYADMLHDTERNQKYYAAVRRAIKLMHEKGREAKVLDIGTGTGLLSMMAVTAGADSVTACEAFHPMADCAARIMKRNNCERINLIAKRSTEVKVGPDGDMPQKANILVTEVFDTELIGEGAIRTFNHAHKYLLETDCIVIPRAANMYAQPVSSDLLCRWNKIDTSLIQVSVPPAMEKCGGAPSLHDLQLDQLSRKYFTTLCQPLPVFRFDFASKNGLQPNRRCETHVEASTNGTVDAIFIWWDCEMDPMGEITLSCAPHWAHPDGHKLPWRDHWMQAIYYPSRSVQVSTDHHFTLLSCHDEYSLWFDVSSAGSSSFDAERPMCRCGVHSTLSRSRIGMMGDPLRVNLLKHLINQHVERTSVCLCISDGSLLPLMAACKTSQVYVLEPSLMSRHITRAFIEHNKLGDNITILDKPASELTPSDIHNQQIDIVIGEPYFASSLLPWHNIHLWYAVTQLKDLLSQSACVLPSFMTIKAVAMGFDHLWKIRAPVGKCEGFDLTEFDNLIQTSADIADSAVEPQPLWEYPGLALSRPTSVLHLDSSLQGTALQSAAALNIETNGRLNGVAVWTEFEFGSGLVMSCGPIEEVHIGERVVWDMYTRQGVHLLKAPRSVNKGDIITVTLHFKPETGEFDFAFKF